MEERKLRKGGINEEKGDKDKRRRVNKGNTIRKPGKGKNTSGESTAEQPSSAQRATH